MAVTSTDESRLSQSQRDELQAMTDKYNAGNYTQSELKEMMDRAAYIRANPEDESGNLTNNGYYTESNGTYDRDRTYDANDTGPAYVAPVASVSTANTNKTQTPVTYTQEDLENYINQALANYKPDTSSTDSALANLNSQVAALVAAQQEAAKTPTAYFTWDDYWNNRDTYINNMTKSPTTYINWDDYWNRLNGYIDDGKQAAIDANTAATDLSIQDINATLQNGLPQYSTLADSAYLQKLAAENNTALNANAAGDIGGLYQRQYSYADNAYDQQLLNIALEKQNFVNSCQQQIDALKAQGRYNEAQLISDWANTRIQMYDQAMQTVYSINQSQQQIDQSSVNSYNNLIESMYGINQNQQQIDLSAYQWDKQFAYNKAMELLEQGFVTAESLVNLGVTPSEAQSYADRINELAQVNLAYAKAELQNLYNTISKNTTTSTSSGTGTSGSGTGGSGSNGNSKGTYGYTSAAFGDLEKATLSEALSSGQLEVVRADGSRHYAQSADGGKSVLIDGTKGWQAGDTISLSYDPSGKPVSYVYDGNGNFVTVSKWNAMIDEANKANNTTSDVSPNTPANNDQLPGSIEEWYTKTATQFGINPNNHGDILTEAVPSLLYYIDYNINKLQTQYDSILSKLESAEYQKLSKLSPSDPAAEPYNTAIAQGNACLTELKKFQDARYQYDVIPKK